MQPEKFFTAEQNGFTLCLERYSNRMVFTNEPVETETEN
jgi:hypothetical protein